MRCFTQHKLDADAAKLEKKHIYMLYLISTLKADFCRFAARLHCVDEDAETFLLASEKAEG